LETILAEYQRILGFEKWHYVFYCGIDSIPYWREKGVHPSTELRALSVDNLPKASNYSDFMKQKWLWESLRGEFVLTIQADTWPLDCGEPYTIEHYISLQKSYIGGNIPEEYAWPQLARDNWRSEFRNFNGGLSLRKRRDMIRVIEAFPPLPTAENEHNQIFEADAEDVYFVIGCHRLGLAVSDDAATFQFSINMSFPEDARAFGIHKPWWTIWPFVKDRYPDVLKKNPYLIPPEYL
jgi:hypothetical protein